MFLLAMVLFRQNVMSHTRVCLEYFVLFLDVLYTIAYFDFRLMSLVLRGEMTTSGVSPPLIWDLANWYETDCPLSAGMGSEIIKCLSFDICLNQQADK